MCTAVIDKSAASFTKEIMVTPEDKYIGREKHDLVAGTLFDCYCDRSRKPSTGRINRERRSVSR